MVRQQGRSARIGSVAALAALLAGCTSTGAGRMDEIRPPSPVMRKDSSEPGRFPDRAVASTSPAGNIEGIGKRLAQIHRAQYSGDEEATLLPMPAYAEPVLEEPDLGEPIGAIESTPALVVDESHPSAGYRRAGPMAKHRMKKEATRDEKSLLRTFGLNNLHKKNKSRRDIGANVCVPRELRMASHPMYTVSPPDVLYIEALDLLPNRPVAGERLVRQDGTISLGYYGQIHVSGLTLAEIEEKIRQRLADYVNDPQVYVDVAAFNSKVFYVVGQVQQAGRLPITGNETVLDALALAGGPTNYAHLKKIHVARPNPGGGCDQILWVDYHAITSAGDTRTNYQLLPGDRVMVPPTKGFLVSTFFDNVLPPFERIAGLGALIRFAVGNNNNN